MIKTYNILLEENNNYKNPQKKIERLVKGKSLFKITKGLYETYNNIPGYLLANAIYNPSYLSFDYALSYYNLIPERVTSYTCATYKKKKEKKYTNSFGNFTYRDIPCDVYPYEIRIIDENEYSYLIASPEKALCDKLYTLKPVKNKKEMIYLLFNDLRIDIDNFYQLDYNILLKLCDLYHSTNLKIFKKVVKSDVIKFNPIND